MSPSIQLAVQLGASVGRAAVGRVEHGRLQFRTLRRFANQPVRMRFGEYVDVVRSYKQIVDAVDHAVEIGSPPTTMTVGATLARHALVADDGTLLGLPRADAGEQVRTLRATVHERLDEELLFAHCGVPAETAVMRYQLAAERPTTLAGARYALLLSDLMGYLLCGRARCGRGAAAMSGLLDCRTGDWSQCLSEAFRIPARLLAPLTDVGDRLGDHTPTGGPAVEVVAPPSPIAAAMLATSDDPTSAVVHCGYAASIGIEVDAPVLSADAHACGLINTFGLDGTRLVVRTLPGMSIIDEACRRKQPGSPQPKVAEVLDAAARSGAPVAVPMTLPETVRAAIADLAASYADALHTMSAITGRELRTVYLTGGGSRSSMLAQDLADATGLVVVAGPSEAVLIGSMLAQWAARARDERSQRCRAVARRSIRVAKFVPAVTPMRRARAE